jgi:REP element-mobilizing transposase RayT
MALYEKYISPIVDTFAYCLMPNHFHFLIRINDVEQERGSFEEPRSYHPISKQFATFFGTYTKAINKAYRRTGRLFEDRFKRKPVTNDAYFTALIAYIHQNPQRHGLIDDFRDWTYSSYGALVSQKPTRLARTEVVSWFDDRDGFVTFHQDMADFKKISSLIGD